MGVCKKKQQSAGSDEDKLLFKTCTESTEYLHLYFKELKNHLIKFKKIEELYNFCYLILADIKSPINSRITSLKAVSLSLIIEPKNIQHLINSEIVEYAYKLLKRNKEGINTKKSLSYFGKRSYEDIYTLVLEANYLFKTIQIIKIIKNSKEYKFIDNIFKKIRDNKIDFLDHDNFCNTELLNDIKKLKNKLLNVLDQEFIDNKQINDLHSEYTRLISNAKDNVINFLYNGLYSIYCETIDEIEDENLSIRVESYFSSIDIKSNKNINFDCGDKKEKPQLKGSLEELNNFILLNQTNLNTSNDDISDNKNNNVIEQDLTKNKEANKTVSFNIKNNNIEDSHENDDIIDKEEGGEAPANNIFNCEENQIMNNLNKSQNEFDINIIDEWNKLKGFKDVKNNGNEHVWNCIIKKSNFYKTKEDYINYNKFLQEKENGLKENTFGDLLEMNKYIDSKNENKNNEQYEESNNLINDKFTKKNSSNNTIINVHNNNINNDLHIKNKEHVINYDSKKKQNISTSSNNNTNLSYFNKYFTQYDNIFNVQEAILKNKSLLYSDDSLEIFMDQNYYDVKGLIKFIFKNKRQINFYDLDMQISNKILFPLKFKFVPYEKLLSAYSTKCYEMAVKCSRVYNGFPLIKISYRMQDMLRKNIEIRLPIAINKFMKKTKITREIFDKFWNNENFNTNKEEKIITKDDNMNNDMLIERACLGEALSICYIEDKICLCGCYSDNSSAMENYFVLVGIEVMKKKIKITCKSNNSTLSSAILFLIILMFKNH
ncbi:clathrin adaptor domain-containing protein [Plasmodium yoelii yoelii]|uniref:Clathrin adaptor domain-containing protein n=1 Tax=Plasmodium yoelii yoelii TaxID=73239 RepID=A0AAE9WVN4_PLAYO|nr:clathrin adaptor domain-containing protein [Plasmodium yoelii yoelii]